MPSNQLGVYSSLDAQVDCVVNGPEVSGHVLGVVDVFFGWLRRAPAYPELGVTAVLGNERTVSIVLLALLEPERLPAHSDLQVIGRPVVALLGGAQVAVGKKRET